MAASERATQNTGIAYLKTPELISLLMVLDLDIVMPPPSAGKSALLTWYRRPQSVIVSLMSRQRQLQEGWLSHPSGPPCCRVSPVKSTWTPCGQTPVVRIHSSPQTQVNAIVALLVPPGGTVFTQWPIVTWQARREGLRFRDVVHFDSRRLARDILGRLAYVLWLFRLAMGEFNGNAVMG